MSIVPEDPKEQEREDLYLRGVRRYGHLPELADRWLTELLEDGSLRDISATQITHKGKPLCQPILEDPVNTPSNPFVHPARLDNGQVVWVRLDERRSSAGHEYASVVDKPNAVRAVLAAVTVMEARQVDLPLLRSALPFLEPSHPKSIIEGIYENLRKVGEEGDTEAAQALRDGTDLDHRSLEYAVALLRYFRPDFDCLPLQDQRALLEKCCERMNEILKATRLLNEFLEYGSPDKDQRAGLEDPNRDVLAATLRDIEGHTYRKIANILSVPLSEKARREGDYSTVVKMVARGREVLERAFGSQEWKDKAEVAKIRYQSWKSSPQEQLIEQYADDWSVPPDLARAIIVERLDPDLNQIQDMPGLDFDAGDIRDARQRYELLSGSKPEGSFRCVVREGSGRRTVINIYIA